MRTSDQADGAGVKCPVKCRWLRPAPGGSDRGWGSGENRARFVLKTGLDGQLDSHLGGHRHIGIDPHRDKMTAKNGDFEAINTPLIPKLTPLKSLF